MAEENLSSNILCFKIGQIIPRDTLAASLQSCHYESVRTVEEPGQYAVRGAAVDIFPLSYRAPIRLQFDLDRVESIRDFSLHEGKSLTTFEEVFLLPVTEAFRRKQERLKSRYGEFKPAAAFEDIRPGDYVVHIEYGVAQFLGTKSLQIAGTRGRHLALEFAQGEILYLPFDQHQLLDRYIGVEGKKPKLTRLHTKEWVRTKARVQAAVKTVARDLVSLQAKRSVKPGFAFPRYEQLEDEFAKTFPFPETPDQRRATEETAGDMEAARPMDRLICGDVGFGKTEIAVRAAYKAVLGGKQVAFLAPTTLLAEQHYVTLEKRLEAAAVRVDLLSRYRSRKAQKAVIERAQRGEIDILIGTHRLLSKDVEFQNLGLAIIDEEQRFGVRHKERLKQMREVIDVLTLTATPIPRTLYMSLMGVRNMSTLETPPRERLPIHTEILEFDNERIRKAIQNELDRKGQVYFVHNRIQSVEKIHSYLSQLLPHASFAVAHGQMPASTLEKAMAAFIEGGIDCLISTNIIESGIDIPNVNTILVNRADAFGLSDLYQLRGRVGRYPAARQAYAYFLVPKNWVLTQDAEKRLAAIERFSALGSGFKIALQDLEIRGAGNLLGHEQSGFVYQVGFDLYCKMLKAAVDAEKTCLKRYTQ